MPLNKETKHYFLTIDNLFLLDLQLINTIKSLVI